MKIFVKSALVLGVVFGLSNCGGGTSTLENQQNSQAVKKIGHFIDSAVDRIAYKTDSGLEGFTNKEGSYYYREGDKVTFSIGKLSLGECTPEIDGLVTPKTLSIGSDEIKVKILRFLQTIDEDRNPSNGIKIADETIVAFESIVDKKLISDFTDDADFLTLSSAIKKLMDRNDDGTMDVNRDSALEHFNESVKKWKERISGTPGNQTGSGNQTGNQTGNESNNNNNNNSSSSENVYPALSDANKQDYLEAINVARGNIQHCGKYGDFSATTPLRWNNALYKASYEHTYDLVSTNTMSHDGSGTQYDWTAKHKRLSKGSSMIDRIVDNGYKNWSTAGENITAGTHRDTAEKAVASWLKSDGHCKNLMNPRFTEVGMAHIKNVGTTYTHYWTQNFGRQH